MNPELFTDHWWDRFRLDDGTIGLIRAYDAACAALGVELNGDAIRYLGTVNMLHSIDVKQTAAVAVATAIWMFRPHMT